MLVAACAPVRRPCGILAFGKKNSLQAEFSNIVVDLPEPFLIVFGDVVLIFQVIGNEIQDQIGTSG